MATSEEIHPEIGTLLKQICKREGLSASAAAKKCGLARSTWNHLEHGKSKPSQKTVEKIVQHLGRIPLEDDPLIQGLYIATRHRTLHGTTNPVVHKVARLVTRKDLLPTVVDKVETDIMGIMALWLKYNEAKQAQYDRRWGEAVSLCEEAYDEMRSLASRFNSYVLDTKAASQLHLGLMDGVRATHDQVEELLHHIDDAHLKALHHMHRGDYYRDQGEWSGAIAHYTAAQRTFARVDESKQEARSRRKIATVRLFQGDWREAKKHLLICQDIFEAANDEYELINTHYALGWVYNLSGDWEKATEHHICGNKYVETLRVQNSDQYLSMLANLYLGNDIRQSASRHIFQDRLQNSVDTFKELSSAETYINKALELSEQLGDKRERGWIYLQLARIFLQRAKLFREEKKYAKATAAHQKSKDYFEKSDGANREINYLYRRAMTLVHYSQLKVDQSEFAQALAKLRQAQAIAGDLKCSYYSAEICVFLYDLYWQMSQEDPESPETKKLEIRLFSLAEEIEIHHSNFTFHNFMAYLRSIQAKVDLDRGKYEQAGKAFADAFYHAFTFNQHCVQEILAGYAQTIEWLKKQKFPSPTQLDGLVRDTVNGLNALVARDTLPKDHWANRLDTEDFEKAYNDITGQITAVFRN